MRWLIVYSDGSEFSSADGPPEAAPGLGIVGIGQEDELVGAAVHRGEHYYVFDVELYGGWANVNAEGFVQYVARPGKKVIKLGEMMDTRKYRELAAALQEHPLMPSKSARYPWEGSL